MGICIPLEHMHLLIQKFRLHGWNFIYQLIVTYLLFLKESLLQADDESEFLVSLNTKNSMEYGRVWEELIENALNFPLDFKKDLNSQLWKQIQPNFLVYFFLYQFKFSHNFE